MSNEQLIVWGFAGYIAIALAYSYLRSSRIRGWPSVAGKLLVAEVEFLHVTDRGSASADVSYEYEVAGQTYVGNRLSPLVVSGQVAPRIRKQLAKIQYVSPGCVRVLYNPRDPSQSYLIAETWIDIFR